MWSCSIAGIIGCLIYIPIYYVLIHYLPEECRQSKIFYGILAGMVILFFMTTPLWCYSWPSFLAAAGFSISASVIIATDWSCCWIPDEPIILLLIIDGFMLAGQYIIIDSMVCTVSLFFYVGLYLLFPKGIGSGDISGDYNSYQQTQTIDIQNVEIVLKGEQGIYRLAIWQKDGYAYSLSISEGADERVWTKILMSVQ